jgi:hypothetical protein
MTRTRTASKALSALAAGAFLVGLLVTGCARHPDPAPPPASSGSSSSSGSTSTPGVEDLLNEVDKQLDADDQTPADQD